MKQCATSFVMISPGLGRALIVYYNFSLQDAVNIPNYVVMAIATVLLINDIVKKRIYSPFAVVLIVFVLMHLAWNFRDSVVWQNFGEAFALIFF